MAGAQIPAERLEDRNLTLRRFPIVRSSQATEIKRVDLWPALVRLLHLRRFFSAGLPIAVAAVSVGRDPALTYRTVCIAR